jgi:NTP pyrophosphatase (non-canonical NTP hydrolase)
MTVPDEYQQLALKTWHNVDVPQDEQINHAMLQLAAEAGEVVKLWAKSRYKPGHEITREMILNETGDLWYYVRIVCYLFGITIEELTRYNADKLQGGHGWNGSSEKVMERIDNDFPCLECHSEVGHRINCSYGIASSNTCRHCGENHNPLTCQYHK